MLDYFPTELRLKTLAYLGVSDLHNLQLVCRSWREFFLSNESSIYRHAAILLGFARLEITLVEAKKASPPGSMGGVDDWKAFVKRHFQIEKNWQGKGQPKVKEFLSPGNAVHRIKIDDQAGYIITTAGHGGVVVADLYEDEVLWSLPEEYVRDCAHCEYGEGYLIFDRIGDFKEVWRRAGDFQNTTVPIESLPDAWQLEASADAAEHYRSTAPRGHFRPWALIETPEFGRAFRFVYPTLLVAGENRAFLWDIITARRTVTINDIQMPVEGTTLGRISYVEVSERYVVICGSRQLRIFNRPQGTLVYHIAASQPKFAKVALELTCPEGSPGNRDIVLVPLATSARADSVGSEILTPQFISELGADSFVAAHISPCGSILVALLYFGRAIIIGNLERVVNGEVDLADAALDINMHTPSSLSSLFPYQAYSTYLAVGDGRVGCATRGGIYVLTLDGHAHEAPVDKRTVRPALQGAQSPCHPLFPHIVVCQATHFSNAPALAEVSCLQMTDTSLFATYKRSLHPLHPSTSDMPQLLVGHGDNTADGVDFAQRIESEHHDGVIAGDSVHDLQAHEVAGPSTQSAFEEEENENHGPVYLQSVSDLAYDSDDEILGFQPATMVVSVNFVPE